ncbi:hypothetical protein Hanom_Chr08g00705911 [Helianthus anomalus]
MVVCLFVCLYTGITLNFPWFIAIVMVVKVPPRLRVLSEYSLQGRLPRLEYCSPKLITPRVISA